MGVEEKVAYQIVAVRRGPYGRHVKSVDEFVTLAGIDKATADKIRPYVRTN